MEEAILPLCLPLLYHQCKLLKQFPQPSSTPSHPHPHPHPHQQSRLVARRTTRLTNALVGADGACEITVVPSRNAESHFQLADIKGKALDKEGIV